MEIDPALTGSSQAEGNGGGGGTPITEKPTHRPTVIFQGPPLRAADALAELQAVVSQGSFDTDDPESNLPSFPV